VPISVPILGVLCRSVPILCLCDAHAVPILGVLCRSAMPTLGVLCRPSTVPILGVLCRSVVPFIKFSRSERERYGEESGVVEADYKKWRCSKMNESGPS